MYKSAISIHYLLNQWLNFKQTCIDIYCYEGVKNRVDFSDLDLIFKVTPAL